MKKQLVQQLSFITLSIQGNDKVLRNLNQYKTLRPGDISQRVVKEAYRETAPLCTSHL